MLQKYLGTIFLTLGTLLPPSGVLDANLIDWPETSSCQADEVLFLRRIADFWEEGEFEIAKNQMEAFLKTYPLGPFSDSIRLFLGDYLIKKNHFSEALFFFSNIRDPGLMEKAQLSQIECYFSLGQYPLATEFCEKTLQAPLNEADKIRILTYHAFSLLRQCFDSTLDSCSKDTLAKKAQASFEILLNIHPTKDVVHASAELHKILGDFREAAELYLAFCRRQGDPDGEMAFQAAIHQAQYDKNLALRSLDEIQKSTSKFSSEAAYLWCILSFELGNYTELLKTKEQLLSCIPTEKLQSAKILMGRCLIGLKKYDEAKNYFASLAEDSIDGRSSLREEALKYLIESAFHCQDLNELNRAIAELNELPSSDEFLLTATLFRAQLLKNSGRINEALEEIENLLQSSSEFPDRFKAQLEAADLEWQKGCWESCRTRALDLIKMNPPKDWIAQGWRYVAAASEKLASLNPEHLDQLKNVLKELVEQKNLFSDEELSDRMFQIAKACYLLKEPEEAILILESISQKENCFSQRANSLLLLAVCYRDEKKDEMSFCKLAEQALLGQADIFDLQGIRIALFNTYLHLSKNDPSLLEKGAQHLFTALEKGAEISSENLLWLGEWYKDRKDYEQASFVYRKILEKEYSETAAYRLAEIQSMTKQLDLQIATLEQLIEKYRTNPKAPWLWSDESKLLLARAYSAIDEHEKSLNILNELLEGQTIASSETIANALLQQATALESRIGSYSPEDSDFCLAASKYKHLILQRKLAFEPAHLEAALRYVDLMAQKEAGSYQKRLSLLEKIKIDFQRADDILSKDYQEARTADPGKNQLFLSYMDWIEAEILTLRSELSSDPSLQKELQGKAKDLLLQINSECTHPYLLERLCSQWQKTDVPTIE